MASCCQGIDGRLTGDAAQTEDAALIQSLSTPPSSLLFSQAEKASTSTPRETSPLARETSPVARGALMRDPAVSHASFVQKIVESLDDAKAENIIVLDLAGKTALADTMAIASGRSSTHVGAIAERVVKACKEAGLSAPRVEGGPANDWVLVDAGDAIIHIFRPDVRQFYNLEKLWGGDRPSDKAGDQAQARPAG